MEMRNLIQYVVVASVLNLSSGAGVHNRASTKNGYLTLDILTKENVEGTYYVSRSEIGIRFVTSLDSLSVTSSNGDQVIQVSQAVGNFRVFYIGKTMFVQKTSLSEFDRNMYTDYAVPIGLKNKFTSSQLQDVLFYEQLTNSLEVILSSYHQLVLQESIFTLTSSLEAKLMIEAVMAMGRDLAITGLDYPSLLPFYMTAMKLDLLIANSTLLNKPGDFKDKFQDTTVQLSDSDYDCLDDCPPCEEELCLGMCGYSCNCWKWVCGDCCYHLGCYDHDVCCREKFVQTKCLFPFGFKCESEYEC